MKRKKKSALFLNLVCCVMPPVSGMDPNGAASELICEGLFSPDCSAQWVGPCSVFSMRSSLSITCEHAVAWRRGGEDGWPHPCPPGYLPITHGWLTYTLSDVVENERRDFPGDPVVRTVRFHCTWCCFDPWPGNLDPTSQALQLKKKKKSEEIFSKEIFFFPWLRGIPTHSSILGLPWHSDVKNPPAMLESWFDPWVGKIPWRSAWQPTPAFLPGESPWTKETGGLQSMGLQRFGPNWET